MISEFVAAINQIAAERGIEKEEIFQALESAILVAYKKEKYADLTKNYEEDDEDESCLLYTSFYYFILSVDNYLLSNIYIIESGKYGFW